MVREFGSTIGSHGWGKRRQDDGRTPVGIYRIKVTFSTTPGNPGRMPWRRRLLADCETPVGVYRIKVTFSTTPGNPGRMPWRRRLPTSTVTDRNGPLYNTWIEEPGRTDGDRPSMRWGFVVDYNNVRLRR